MRFGGAGMWVAWRFGRMVVAVEIGVVLLKGSFDSLVDRMCEFEVGKL